MLIRFLPVPKFFLFAFCLFWGLAFSSTQKVIVELTEERGNRDELLEFAGKLIMCKPGAAIDSATVASSVEALNLTGLFTDIKVSNSDSTVTFLLAPARYIRDIRIEKSYPLFRDDVERVLSIYPGDVFRNEAVLRQDSIITALYRREGFVAPSVEIATHAYRGKCDSVVDIRIKAGDYYRLKDIEITGNRAKSAFSIKRNMRSWMTSIMPGSAGRFVRSMYNEDIEKCLEIYRKSGFADIAIHDTLIIDSVTRSVKAVLTINEGDKYVLKSSRRSGRGVKREVQNKAENAFRNGNRNNVALRRLQKSTENYLKEEGFLNAHLAVYDTVIAKRKKNKRIVTIDIQRNDRTTVSSIVITGSSSVSNDEILGQVLHTDKGNEKQRAYSPERLQEDAFAIEQLYNSRGFLQAKASARAEIKDNNASIYIEIDEGMQTKVGEVSVDSISFPGMEIPAVLSTKAENPFRTDQLKSDKRVLEAKISELGYPHVVVTPVVTFNADSTNADVLFKIDLGPRVILGEVRYAGALKTKERVLNREFKAVKGMPLSLSSMVESQRNIRDMGLFSSVRLKTIGLREKQDTVHVVVEVTEKRPYHGVLGGGYESEKRVFINAKAGDRNFLGSNRELWVGAEASQIDEAVINKAFQDVDGRAEVGMTEHRLFGLPLIATDEIYAERTSELNIEWRSVAYGVSAAINAAATKHLLLGMGSRLERRSLLLEDGEESTEDKGPRTSFVLTPTLTYDRRDSFTKPKKGTFLGMSVDLSKSIGSSVDNYVKFQMEAKSFLTPLSFVTFAGIVRAGYIHPYGGTTVIPTDRLFYLGGTRSVRGFKENLLVSDSSGGRVALSASLEARIPLVLNFELAGFYDIGRLQNSLASIDFDQFRMSAGGGIRYMTPIGPIGLLYGRKISKKPGEEDGAFHFSIGYTF